MDCSDQQVNLTEYCKEYLGHGESPFINMNYVYLSFGSFNFRALFGETGPVGHANGFWKKQKCPGRPGINKKNIFFS